MRIKSLICVIAVLFVVGFSGSALAVLDATGDELVAGYDIEETSILYFDAPASEDDSIKLTLNMNTGGGSKLPGMLILEVDVDDKASTGGNIGMAGIFKTCASGGTSKLKEQAGLDILLMLMLRDQISDGSTAWCDGCTGSGVRCFLRGAACDGVCGGTDCFKLGDGCGADSGPDCYVMGDACNEPRPTCDTCYELNVVCTSTSPCNVGRRRGEWYAETIATSNPGGGPAAYGRIDMPLPKEADDASGTDGYPLPWGRIIELVHAKATAVADPARVFDLAEGQDPANFNYQVSVWYDGDDTSPPANDFVDETMDPDCGEVSDVVPDAGLASVETIKTCTGGCNGDFDTDADVDGTDAVNFKADFFRKNCLNTEFRAR